MKKLISKCLVVRGMREGWAKCDRFLTTFWSSRSVIPDSVSSCMLTFNHTISLFNDNNDFCRKLFFVWLLYLKLEVIRSISVLVFSIFLCDFISYKQNIAILLKSSLCSCQSCNQCV